MQNDERQMIRPSAEGREAHHVELIRATAAFEHAVLRVAFLLNGGALIATMTFLGNVWPKEHFARGSIVTALLIWILGLVMAGFATHYGYLSQHNFLKAFRRNTEWLEGLDGDLKTKAEKHSKDAEDQRETWKFFVLVSLALFGMGSAVAILSLI